MSVAVWKRTLYRSHISCKLWDFFNAAARKGNQFCHLFSQLNIDPNFAHFTAASLPLLLLLSPFVQWHSVRTWNQCTVNLLPSIFFFRGSMVHTPRRARIRHSLNFHHTLSPPLCEAAAAAFSPPPPSSIRPQCNKRQVGGRKQVT